LKTLRRLFQIHAMRLFARFGNMQRVVASLADPDSSVRWEAVTILAMLPDEVLRAGTAVSASLQNIGSAQGIESITTFLEDQDETVRRTAAWALRKLGWHPSQNTLGAAYWIAMREVNPCVAIGTPAIKPLIQALIGNDSEVRQAAAVALQKIGSAATDDLIVIIQHRGPATYGHWDGIALAASSLGTIGDARAVEPLIAALANDNREVRISAIGALGKLGDPRAVGALVALLENAGRDGELRIAITVVLGKLGDPRAVYPLIAALKRTYESERYLQDALANALRKLYRRGQLGHREKQAIISLKGFVLQRGFNLHSEGAHFFTECASGGTIYEDFPESHSDVPERRFEL